MKHTPVTRPQHPGVNIACESVAGEEDPGAALDLLYPSTIRGAVVKSDASAGHSPSVDVLVLNPGDASASGTPGSEEAICRVCDGTEQNANAPCKTCGGTGKVNGGVEDG